jgi:hypothetical protein
VDCKLSREAQSWFISSQEYKVGHFNVVSGPLSQEKFTLDINLDGRSLADDKIGSSTAREYLRVFYSDSLGGTPAKGHARGR